MILYIFFFFLMTLLGSIASLFLKKAAKSAGIFALLKNPHLYAGIFLYITAALLTIYVLRFFDYSIVMPCTSLTYAWTMIIAKLFLHEDITKRKKYGLALIIAGASLIMFM